LVGQFYEIISVTFKFLILFCQRRIFPEIYLIPLVNAINLFQVVFIAHVVNDKPMLTKILSAEFVLVEQKQPEAAAEIVGIGRHFFSPFFYLRHVGYLQLDLAIKLKLN